MKYIQLFEEFNQELELNERKPTILKDIIPATLIGSLIGAGIGLMGGPVGALIGAIVGFVAIGSISILVYIKSKQEYNDAVKMIIYEYGKDNLDPDKMNKLISKYQKSTERVQNLKKSIIKDKQKIEDVVNNKDEALTKAMQTPKMKKQIAELIKYESLDLAHESALDVYWEKVLDLEKKYGMDQVGSALPNIYDIHNQIKDDMEKLSKVEGIYITGDFSKMYLDSNATNADIQNQKTFMKIRKEIIKDYRNYCLNSYEKEYKNKLPFFQKELTNKYRDGIVMKESVEYFDFELLNN